MNERCHTYWIVRESWDIRYDFGENTTDSIYPGIRYTPGKFCHGSVRVVPIAVGITFPANADSIYASADLRLFTPRVYAICIRVI